MSEVLLRAKGISIAFGGLKALDKADLHVEEGSIYSLIGPNGAGKTTLFNIISGTLKGDFGNVEFMGRDITGRPPYEICRAGISRTFQLKNMFADLSVFENVEAGLLKDPLSKSEREHKVWELLKFLEIESIAETEAASITPLESKLVELARALSTSPKLILLDELIGGLLPSETDKICEIVETLRDQGLTILQVGHEIRPIMRTSDRIFVLDQGRNVADGPPQEIRKNEDVVACYLEQGGD
jgi:branched-chain amino acid transport system ATP-binding protein